MRTLAVFAQFDPDGIVPAHTLRYLTALAGVTERLVVVSSSPELSQEGRKALAVHGEVLTRENQGYDFGSWAAGLQHVGEWDAYDRVVLCNDSVVGPFAPLADVLGSHAPSDADFWGITTSREIQPHVQSWFMVYERSALASGAPQRFWSGFEPISDRYRVIRAYEVGASRGFREAGLRMGQYLRPRSAELVRAQVRYRRALRSRPDRAEAARAYVGAANRLGHAWNELVRPMWNPSYVFWDLALDGRLPLVKLDLLRDDPYRMGKGRVLAALEQAHPDVMEGVAEYLKRTRKALRRLRGA